MAASSGLVFANGLGSIAGPLGAASLMSLIGPVGLLWFVLGVHGALGVFALYRVSQRPPVALKDQGRSAPLPAGASPIAAAQVTQYARTDKRNKNPE